MRLVQFRAGESERLGVELGLGGDILDLNADGSFPYSRTLDLLTGGADALDLLKRMVAGGTCPLIPRKKVALQSPITGPDKVLCVGMNYRDHCEEQHAPLPVEPVIFNKFPSNIVGPEDNIEYPPETHALDWEVELAIVIGKKGKNIHASDAFSHVFGFTVAHDVSARDWQLHKNGGQWLLGKAMDNFCPLGPAIVTTDELGDPHKLRLQCRVNGVQKQDGNTKELVHKTEDIVAFISRFVTLLPGDVILTGTPCGVGVFRKPPEYLKKGDVVECEIENIGTITNKIV